MDETQFISVEDQAMQDSSDADDLGKGITNLGKAIRDYKKSSDNQFAFMKEQFAAILAVLPKKTVYTGKIPPSGFSGSIPHPLVKRYEHHPLKLSEVDLPTFKGENPEAWLRNCESYFQFHFIKYEEWVNSAESHLDDRARIWYTSWKLDKRFITWTIFCNELCRWFDSQRYNDVVDEASKVEQPQDSVEKFGACKVIDKMPSRVPSSVVEDSCTYRAAENMTHNVIEVVAEKVVQQEVFVQMPKSITTTQHSFSLGHVVPNKEVMLLGSEIGQPSLLGMKSLEADYNLFEERPERIPLGQRNGSVIHEEGVFMFDPGGGSNCKGCMVSTSIATYTHELDVELWIGKILMFVFDPGGSSWFHDGCDSLLFTENEQHFNKSCGWTGSLLAFLGNGKVMLIVLFNVCIGTYSGTVVEIMVVDFGWSMCYLCVCDECCHKDGRHERVRCHPRVIMTPITTWKWLEILVSSGRLLHMCIQAENKVGRRKGHSSKLSRKELLKVSSLSASLRTRMSFKGNGKDILMNLGDKRLTWKAKKKKKKKKKKGALKIAVKDIQPL